MQILTYNWVSNFVEKILKIIILNFMHNIFKKQIKKEISNLVRTRRIWNNLHQVRSKSKRLENQIIVKVLGVSKPKGLCSITKIDQGHLCLREENLNSITKIDQGHLCLREENLSFNNKINQIFGDTYKINFTNYTPCCYATKWTHWNCPSCCCYCTTISSRTDWKK